MAKTKTRSGSGKGSKIRSKTPASIRGGGQWNPSMETPF